MDRRLNYKDFDSIKDTFILEAINQGECTLSGDNRKGNKSSEKLFKIWRAVKGGEYPGARLVDELISHHEMNVRCWICAIALDINYRTDEAEAVLKAISDLKRRGSLVSTPK